jgi:hypothetical protein
MPEEPRAPAQPAEPTAPNAPAAPREPSAPTAPLEPVGPRAPSEPAAPSVPAVLDTSPAPRIDADAARMDAAPVPGAAILASAPAPPGPVAIPATSAAAPASATTVSAVLSSATEPTAPPAPVAPQKPARRSAAPREEKNHPRISPELGRLLRTLALKVALRMGDDAKPPSVGRMLDLLAWYHGYVLEPSDDFTHKQLKALHVVLQLLPVTERPRLMPKWAKAGIW